MPEQTPGRRNDAKSGLAGFGGWTCQSKPPGRRNEAKSGLGWTSQGKPPGRRNQAGSAWSGFGGGHAKPDPREEEIRLEVRGLEVDISEQTPGKKK